MKFLKASTLASALGVLLSFGSAGSVQANLITNGGFETGDTTGWTALSTAGATPWTLCCGAFGSAPAANGSYLAIVGFTETVSSLGSLSQTIATVAGSTYNISFDYGAFGGPGAQSITLAVSGSSLGPQVITDPTATFDRATLLSGYSYYFTATGASSTITFTDSSATSGGLLGALDNVKVVVPLPGSLALLGLGLAGLGLSRRRTA